MAKDGAIEHPRSVHALTIDTIWSAREMIPKGYAINTATIVGLVMWAWFMPVVVRDVVRWRRGRRSGCLRCGYDVRGLAGSVCPECGSALRETPTPAG